MIKTKIWVTVIVILLIACVVACVVVFTKKTDDNKRVEVYCKDELVFSADLKNVTEPYEKTIETECGRNVLEIANGKARIKDADCDGKDCVHMGWTDSAAKPIVCLPHYLVVKIVSEEEIDVVSK